MQLQDDEQTSPRKTKGQTACRLAMSSVVLFIGAVGISLIILSFFIQQPVATSLVVSNGAVASDTKICSEIGTGILVKGGNAVDAAISTGLCLGVVSSYASGIGGGGFMMVHMSTSQTQDFIDFREVAGQLATADMFEKRPANASTIGGLAIAVPGEVRGYYEAWLLYGSLPWADLFQPAIDLANGFACTRLLEMRISSAVKYIQVDPGLSEIYMPNGVLLKEGQMVYRKNLAATLRSIASGGPDALYTGNTAETLSREIQAIGGILQASDFNNYKAVHRQLLSTYYHGFRVMSAFPPTSSPLIGFMLNILDKYALFNPSEYLTQHYIVEALKHGFGHHISFGDTSFVNITNLLDLLLNKGYANSISQMISATRTFPSEYYMLNQSEWSLRNLGTSSLSVIDKDRNAVAMTLTVNLNFGSKFMSPSTGIVLNNEMDDFSTSLTKPNAFGLLPSKNNMIAPGKRPGSLMSPLLILDGNNIFMAIGGSGGPTIVSSILQVILGIMNFGKDPKVAVDTIRFHDQLFPRRLLMEPGWDSSIMTGLTKMGHNLTYTDGVADGQSGIGCIQVVTCVPQNDGSTLLMAASDIRKFGVPDGY